MRQIIFNIHGIGTPERELEPGEAAYWISPEQFREAVAMARDHRTDVGFSFDDSNRSDLTYGAPILRDAGNSQGISADFFVLAGRIDQPGSLSADDIRALRDMGHRIGSHGMDHVDWTGLDAAGARRELYEARDRIADVTDTAITAVGIPFGRYNAAVLKALRKAGYDRAYSSDGGIARDRDFPIARHSLRGDMSRDDIAALLDGREAVKTRLRRAVTSRLKRVI